MWTIIGAPALNIPGFAGQNGLPIGLSVVGARYTDMHLLHVAKAIGALWESEGGFQHKLF
jgi:Asp-tRNA(Asn)/Glu-tRNA(Gln) amidotransferase A subunit family amidase